MVTLLLGRSGDVTDVYSTSLLYTDQYGVVIDSQVKTGLSSDGMETGNMYVTVLLTDGSTVDVKVSTESEDKIGSVAVLSYDSGELELSYEKDPLAMEGYVSLDHRTITDGDDVIKLASDLNVLEVDDYSNVVALSLARLDGITLEEGTVMTATYNGAGEIDAMILCDVTRDTASFGYVTEVDEPEGGTMNAGGSYVYDISGNTYTLRLTSSSLNISEGPSMFYYTDNSIERIINLQSLGPVEDINPIFVRDRDHVIYDLSGNVSVYKKVNGRVILTTLDEAETWEGEVYAYYDRDEAKGGLVRVLYLR